MGESLLAAKIRHAHEEALAAGITLPPSQAFEASLAREMGRQPSIEELEQLLRTWRYIARPEQVTPEGDDWDVWMVLAGRGFGKTRTGAEFVDGEACSKRARRIALVGATAADTRDVMVEGESGILSLYAHRPESDRPRYEPSKRRLTWPNGAVATTYSAEKPDRLRGPQHDLFWADELAAWSTRVKKEDRSSAIFQAGRPPAWDQLQFGLRLGQHPRGIITTTPRPIAIMRELVRDARCRVTGGATYENAANLAGSFLKALLRAYEGTRLGRQELYAEILDDNPNALWKATRIEELRVAQGPVDMRRIVIGVDPAVTSNPESDMTGIVSVGVAPCWLKPNCGGELHAFVMRDDSGIYTPMRWAQLVTTRYKELQADRVIGEVNNGGDLVESNLRAWGDPEVAPNFAYEEVRATRGKEIRAEPASALYEQGKVHHVGNHPQLEDEMTQWDPISGLKSPSRMDALVWALTKLMIVNPPPRSYRSPGHGGSSRVGNLRG